MGDACSNPSTEEEVTEMLLKNVGRFGGEFSNEN